MICSVVALCNQFIFIICKLLAIFHMLQIWTTPSFENRFSPFKSYFVQYAVCEIQGGTGPPNNRLDALIKNCSGPRRGGTRNQLTKHTVPMVQYLSLLSQECLFILVKKIHVLTVTFAGQTQQLVHWKPFRQECMWQKKLSTVCLRWLPFWQIFSCNKLVNRN